ncbi:DUF397 domain-containing protein [Kitasatospora sp. NPDC093806]|uniref:DUF397 domain-containing protein n=1 Tax=Kitasatospora sp. NPDC093806 TaxID=3155075 RepID=UPI003428EB93
MPNIDLTTTRWHRSTYSQQGGNCVEVALDLTSARWRKSTHSQQGGDCIEIAPDFPALVPVRDSKDPAGPALLFPSAAWHSFVTAIQAGEFGTV